MLDQGGRFIRERAYWLIRVGTTTLRLSLDEAREVPEYVKLYSDGSIPELERLRIGELNELLTQLKAGPPFRPS
jgi:hypothetical protein